MSEFRSLKQARFTTVSIYRNSKELKPNEEHRYMAQSTQQVDPFEDTKYMLEQWAAWVRIEGVALGNNSVLSTIIQTVRSDNTANCTITDDDAIVVDKALARLITRDEEIGRVTKAYFLSRCNYLTVARHFLMERKKVARVVAAGVAWVDAYISG